MANESKKLRFGICGVGLMGRGYYQIMSGRSDAKVVALCDADPQRVQPGWYAGQAQSGGGGTDDDAILKLGGGATQNTDGVQTFTNIEQMFAEAELDAVIVTLPTNRHAPVSIAAAERGLHVICEKPMALTVEDCTRMIDASKNAGKLLVIDQCVRFFPQYELIAQYVREQRVGKVKYASLQRLGSPPSHSKDNWMLDHTISGGGLFDLHVHDVDFAQHLFGAPDEISARACPGPSGGIDHVFATHSYEDGRYVVIEGGWCLHNPWPFDMAITVHCEGGSLHWTASRSSNVSFYDGSERREIECPGEGGTRRLCSYFIDQILAQRPVSLCTPESSRLSVALTQIEKQSIESGAPVKVATVCDPDVMIAGRD